MGNSDIDRYFDSVYTETLSSVSRFVVSHAARFQDAEDIIQNVYTRFYKRISDKGYDDIESAEAFVINIAKFECRSFFSGFKKQKDRVKKARPKDNVYLFLCSSRMAAAVVYSLTVLPLDKLFIYIIYYNP